MHDYVASDVQIYHPTGTYRGWSAYWFGGYLSLPNRTWKWTDGNKSDFLP
jgi:5-deoxy-D-glucuronate isomerase